MSPWQDSAGFFGELNQEIPFDFSVGFIGVDPQTSRLLPCPYTISNCGDDMSPVVAHNTHFWRYKQPMSSAFCANTTDLAWIFDFDGGLQGAIYKADSYYAWAVHTGDVGTPATVPVPAAAWLFGSGMLGLIGMSRKRRRC